MAGDHPVPGRGGVPAVGGVRPAGFRHFRAWRGVPGVDLPDSIYDRMKGADDAKDEGYKISLELIDEIKKVKGVHGVHITALFWEDIVPSLVKESGLSPRP